MDFFQRTARIFAMSDATWKRHASPWSIWTRVAILPILTIVLLARVWIGWWAAPIVVALILFTWLNPRLFPAPASTDNWGSKATFGERVLIARKEIPIPPHHATAAQMLSILAGAAGLLWLYGIISLDMPATLAGLASTFTFKFWFLDRMVWLYEDMKDRSEEYASWLY